MVATIEYYWTNLAKNGLSPNGNGDTFQFWPTYNTSARLLMNMAVPTKIQNIPAKNNNCDFWDIVHY